jgi:hypothetical protein
MVGATRAEETIVYTHAVSGDFLAVNLYKRVNCFESMDRDLTF